MSNCSPFQNQLSSIMEVLVKTAIAEICELVDDGYAVLHMEISRSQKENDALKRKLQMMEMKMARRSSLGRLYESRICDDVANSRNENPFPFIERLFGRRTSGSHWDDVEPLAVNAEDSPSQTDAGSKVVEMTQSSPDLIIIKQEMSEENGEPQEMLSSSREELDVEDNACTTLPEVDATHGAIAEQVSEQQRIGRRAWNDGAVSRGVQREDMKEEDLHTSSQHDADNGSSLEYECIMLENVRELDSYYGKDGTGGKSEAACSYAREHGAETVQGQSQLQPVHSAKGFGSRVVSLSENACVQMLDPSVYEGGVELLPQWKKRLHPEGYLSHKPLPADISHVENVPNFFPHKPLVTQRCKIQPKGGVKEKRFVCSYCGKRFPSPQNLETHQRVHTGERPFTCAQCGKRFTQSAHLKTHQSVHTGARPHMCVHCGRRFAGKQNLKIHLQKNHPEEESNQPPL